MDQDFTSLDFKKTVGATRVVSKPAFRIFRNFSFERFDYVLLVLTLIITALGIAAIGSAEPQLAKRQFIGAVVSMFLLFFCSGIDYHVILRFSTLLYITAVVLLLAVLLFGSTGGGAQRWISIAGVRFQPSESAKLLLILFFAQFIMKHKDRMHSFLMIICCLILVAPPLFLVVKEPDLSTTIMLFIIFCVMMFAGGISWTLVIGVLAVALPSIFTVFNLILQEDQTLIDNYQRNRILAWLHPELYEDTYSYQTMNSIMAIGSGQLLGKGYNTNEISSVLNSGYISESQTDFIFTVIGEEFGFLGSCIVIILLLFIAVRCLMTARAAKDTAGMLIATGVGTWVGFQGFMNIGVATGVLPNTGIPLPFVSYGLTSLLCLYAAIGIVISVHMQSGS